MSCSIMAYDIFSLNIVQLLFMTSISWADASELAVTFAGVQISVYYIVHWYSVTWVDVYVLVLTEGTMESCGFPRQWQIYKKFLKFHICREMTRASFQCLHDHFDPAAQANMLWWSLCLKLNIWCVVLSVIVLKNGKYIFYKVIWIILAELWSRCFFCSLEFFGTSFKNQVTRS